MNIGIDLLVYKERLEAIPGVSHVAIETDYDLISQSMVVAITVTHCGTHYASATKIGKRDLIMRGEPALVERMDIAVQEAIDTLSTQPDVVM